MCRHRGRSSLRSSGGCVPTTWRACDSWRVLSGQHPKLRERILTILCPVERPTRQFLTGRSHGRICGYPGHHVTANSELRAGAVNARSRGTSAVGAQRRGIDGAEHSSTIDRVMAAGRTCGPLPDPLADHLLPKTAQLSAGNRHASRNVNDPAVGAWGHPPRAAPGSFTFRLALLSRQQARMGAAHCAAPRCELRMPTSCVRRKLALFTRAHRAAEPQRERVRVCRIEGDNWRGHSLVPHAFPQ